MLNGTDSSDNDVDSGDYGSKLINTDNGSSVSCFFAVFLEREIWIFSYFVTRI